MKPTEIRLAVPVELKEGAFPAEHHFSSLYSELCSQFKHYCEKKRCNTIKELFSAGHHTGINRYIEKENSKFLRDIPAWMDRIPFGSPMCFWKLNFGIIEWRGHDTELDSLTFQLYLVTEYLELVQTVGTLALVSFENNGHSIKTSSVKLGTEAFIYEFKR